MMVASIETIEAGKTSRNNTNGQDLQPNRQACTQAQLSILKKSILKTGKIN